MTTATTKRAPRTNTARPQPEVEEVRKPHRWRRRMIVSIGLLALVWFAPLIVSFTSLADWPLRHALAGINGTISAGSTSYGWLSPVEFRDVQIRDVKGNLLLTAATIRSQRPLWQLAAHSSDLGTLTIAQPKLGLELRPDGSNAEDVLLPWLNRSSTGASPTLALQVADGHIDLHDVAADQRWRVESLAVAMRTTPQSSPAEVSASGSIASGAVQTNTVTNSSQQPTAAPAHFKFTYQSAGATPAGSASDAAAKPAAVVPRVELQMDPLSVAILRPLLARLMPGAQLSGQIAANLQYQAPSGPGAPSRIQGTVQGSDLTLTAPQLGADRPHFDQLRADCRLAWQADRVDVEQLALACDAANLNATGQIALPLPESPTLADWARQAYTINGQLDMAKLCQMLPATLHVRSGTQVTAGQVKLAVQSVPSRTDQVWNAQFATDGLTATDGHRTFTLDQPVAATLALRQSSAGFAIEKFDCQSSFLHATVSGSPDNATLDASCDLARLASELGQFVALGDLQLAGKGQGQIHWQRAAGSPLQLTVTGEVDNLHAWTSGWYIDEPIVKLDSAASWDAAKSRLQLGSTSLLTSTISLHTDGTTVNLTGKTWPAWNGSLAFQADLARLLAWNRDPRTPPEYIVAGRLLGQADVTGSDVALNARFQAAVDQWSVSGTTATRIAPPGGTTIHSPAAHAAVWWQEPRLTLAGSATYDLASDALQLATIVVDSSALRVNGSGQVAHVSTAPAASLSGTIDYDAATLSHLLQVYFGSQLQLVGRQSRPFTIRGPLTPASLSAPATKPIPGAAATAAPNLWLQALAGEGSLGWTSATAYGLQLGAGQINARLAGGALQLNLSETIASQGRLTANPLLRLTPGDPELEFAAGPLLQQFSVSAEQCSQWMKYFSPMLSETAKVDGRLSIDLVGGRMPLGNPAAADIVGQIKIDSLDVTPGPMAHPLSLLTQQVEAIFLRRTMPTQIGGSAPLVKIGPQTVPFRLVGGRLYHQTLAMTVGSVPLRTYGSIGLDESLALVAEMPVQSSWLVSDPNPSRWNNQVVRFTINGTLKDPKVDPHALEQLAAQMVKTTIDNAIVDPIKRDLDRLFHP